MSLVGRERETKLLQSLISKALSEQRGLGILITGASGVGKTSLALFVLESLDVKFGYTVNYEESSFIQFLKKSKKNKVLVLDEFHLCQYQDKLLPLFDKFIVIVITNRPGDVLHAIRTRTVHVQLDPLNISEQISVFIQNYKSLPDLGLLETLCLSTREVEQLARLGRDLELESLKEILETLGWRIWTDSDGREIWVSPDEYRYLETLREYGTLPERSLKVLLNLDSRYQREIESRLSRKKLIEITSRGRRLYGGASESLEKVIIDI